MEKRSGIKTALKIKIRVMKRNMGTTDKIIRLLLAALIAVLYFTGVLPAPVALIAGVIALIFIITSFLSFCPLYVPFKINTRKKK